MSKRCIRFVETLWECDALQRFAHKLYQKYQEPVKTNMISGWNVFHCSPILLYRRMAFWFKVRPMAFILHISNHISHIEPTDTYNNYNPCILPANIIQNREMRCNDAHENEEIPIKIEWTIKFRLSFFWWYSLGSSHTNAQTKSDVHSNQTVKHISGWFVMCLAYVEWNCFGYFLQTYEWQMCTDRIRLFPVQLR